MQKNVFWSFSYLSNLSINDGWQTQVIKNLSAIPKQENFINQSYNETEIKVEEAYLFTMSQTDALILFVFYLQTVMLPYFLKHSS